MAIFFEVFRMVSRTVSPSFRMFHIQSSIGEIHPGVMVRKNWWRLVTQFFQCRTMCAKKRDYETWAFWRLGDGRGDSSENGVLFFPQLGLSENRVYSQ